MAPRKAWPIKPDPSLKNMSSDDEDFNFLASQQSNGSDDQALELAIEQHYAALRKKKRKEQEQKFLKGAFKQLSKDVTTPADDLKASIPALETIHTDFLHRYAANEDTIHKLWAQVQKEQLALLNFTKKRYALNVDAGKTMEAGHIAGLSRTKAACREYQEIINQIAPQDE